MSTFDKLSVRAISSPDDTSKWLRLPHLLFAQDPAWIAPLTMLERDRIARDKNPFFSTADVELFIACKGDKPVGRISAQVNHRYLSLHKDQTGHFGFFDTISDQEVADALLDAASAWLSERGLKRISGPFNFSINEECGVLIDGFDKPSTAMMPQSTRWQASLLERAGFKAEMDLYAYQLMSGKLPAVINWLAESALADQSITVRSFNKKSFSEELALVADIFNDSWSDNWGFVPFTEEDLHFLIADFRLFFRERYGKFVYVNGELAGFAIGIPNINEIIRDYGGRLLPFNWLKMAVALGAERFRSGRLPLLGLKKKFQRSVRGTTIFAALVKASVDDIRLYNLDWIEFSWVLATNKPLTTFLSRNFGAPSKTYRIYGRSLDE